MTTTEKVLSALISVRAATVKAREQTDEIIGLARELTDEAAAHGWDGVATTMGSVTSALENVVGGLAAGVDAHTAVIDLLHGISGETSRRDVAERLGSSLPELEKSVTALQGAVANTDEAIAAGERAGEPARLLGALHALRESLTSAFGQLGDCLQKVEADVAAAGGWGNATGAGGPAPSAPTPPDPQAADPAPTRNVRPTVPGWERVADVPHRARQTAQEFIARPEGANRPTTGLLTDSSGRDRGRFESGGRDRSPAADLRHDPLRGPPVTFYQHVEAKVAALMRRDDLRQAELFLDNTVCGSTDRDRHQLWACHTILPSILPRGSQLTVWVTRDAGQSWWKHTYRGTGERIVHL